MAKVAVGDPIYAAHLALVGLAMLVLGCVEEDGRAMDSCLFVMPFCGDVMDMIGDHASHCPCHGDRTIG
eukprot:5023267-Amphidinium_carterae.1